MRRLSNKSKLERSRGGNVSMRRLSKKLEQEPSRGRVFYNRSGRLAPKLQFPRSSVTVVKNTSGSGFLGSNFLLNLLYLLPLVLFFSYHPVISLGGDGTMNFELSLPMIWLVVFDVFGVVMFLRKIMVRKCLKKWRYLLFPAFVTLSILWSANTLRGVLTCGVMWLIVFAVMIMVGLRAELNKDFSRKFLKWFFGSSLVICAWCLIQCILDVVGVPRENTLICLGCTYRSFGFPHPNGFAIEPQFMGNLLLAPAIVSGWLVLKKQNSKNLKLERSRGDNFYNGSVGTRTKFQFRDSFRDRCKKYSGSRFLGFEFLLFCFSATLFLTFSRGAIYAFFVAMVFMTAATICRFKARQVFRAVDKMWLVIILSFLFTLNLQGVLAQVSPTNDTYQSGVAKVLNHLSLGIIDIRQRDENVVESGAGETESEVVSSEESAEGNESIYDGYVEESTEIRKMLTRNALTLWLRDVKTVLFGVGIGGAGQAMYEAGLTPSPKEIVQNEYASLLLEVGLVGVVLAVVLLIMVLRVVIKSPASLAILSLMVAYAVSLIFFAGLPNALQIYLLPVLLWLALKR
ncbi:O-antigen ligase family protein [Candidatus Saccharibacteria bacterium]|nr:O-antigen ligase family protein [Candidatus Saccharibacteria bacterium]